MSNLEKPGGWWVGVGGEGFIRLAESLQLLRLQCWRPQQQHQQRPVGLHGCARRQPQCGRATHLTACQGGPRHCARV